METCYPDINPATGELELWSDLEHALGKPDIEAAYNATAEDVDWRRVMRFVISHKWRMLQH